MIFRSSLFLSLVSIACLQANPVRPSSITLRHIESGGVGYRYGYTTLQGFFTQNPDTWKVTPFVDLRGHIFNNGTWAANGGLGIRGLIKNRIYGFNSYYDYRGTNRLNYNQVSLGFETLGPLFDFRVNAYIPFGKKITKGYHTQFDSFQGNYMVLKQKKEYVMKGGNAEFGFNVGDCSSWRYYAAAGPYYYRGQIGENAWGGKVRFKVTYKQYISLEIIDSYDNVFKNHVQGQIYFSIPFGKSYNKNSSSSRFSPMMYCRMSDPVEKNEIIVLNKKHQYPIGLDPETGNPYSFLFVNNMSASNGTFESPYHSLAQAQEFSKEGQIIYLYPGDGTTRNLDSGFTFKNNQSLWGTGKSYNLLTQYGNIAIPNLSSSFPKITSVSSIPALTLAQNNELRGVILNSTDQSAIFGIDPVRFMMYDCIVQNCNTSASRENPIHIKTSIPSEFIFINNQFLNNLNSGVRLTLKEDADKTSIVFDNNTALNNAAIDAYGSILLIDPQTTMNQIDLFASNNVFENNNTYSILFTSETSGSCYNLNCNISSNRILQSRSGLSFQLDCLSSFISIKDSYLDGIRSDAILVGAYDKTLNNLNFLASNNTIINSKNPGSGSGIILNGRIPNANVQILNNTISSNDGTGIVYYNGSSNIGDLVFKIENNTLKNNLNLSSNGGGGVSIAGFNALNLTMNNNELSGNKEGSSISYFNPFPNTPNGNIEIEFKNNTLSNEDSFRVNSYVITPQTTKVYMTGNLGTSDPSYILLKQGSGDCFISPSNYLDVNTGTFSISGFTPIDFVQKVQHNNAAIKPSLFDSRFKKKKRD